MANLIEASRTSPATLLEKPKRGKMARGFGGRRVDPTTEELGKLLLYQLSYARPKEGVDCTTGETGREGGGFRRRGRRADQPARPPADRPVGRRRSGASPSPPPAQLADQVAQHLRVDRFLHVPLEPGGDDAGAV